MLFSEHEKEIGSQVSSYNTNYFNSTWVEQDAEVCWSAVCISSKNLISTQEIDPSDIDVVSFSGQIVGCLSKDKVERPLRKSIIWADQRAQNQAAVIAEQISQKDFYHIAGHRNTDSYGIQNLMWICDNEPEIYEQIYKTLNAKDFITFRLVGNFYTEYFDGNSNGCFDLMNLKWSGRILEYVGIDPDKFPEFKPSTFIDVGVTRAAKATGFKERTPVALGGGDCITANVGAGSISLGKTYYCMGTSAWITTTEKPIFGDEMCTVTSAHIILSLYAPNGTMHSAGGVYKWVKNTICRMEMHEAKANGKSPYFYMHKQIEPPHKFKWCHFTSLPSGWKSATVES